MNENFKKSRDGQKHYSNKVPVGMKKRLSKKPSQKKFEFTNEVE